jgi:hypothetical protein
LPTADEIKKEILENIDIDDLGKLKILCGFGAYLSNTETEKASAGLSALESALNAKLQQRDPSSEPKQAVKDAVQYFETHSSPGTAKIEKYRGLLTSVLAESEFNSGFQVFDDGKKKRVRTVEAVLGAKDFRYLLGLDGLFKDPGVDGFHGESTHRIQWYLFARFIEGKNPVNLPEMLKWIPTQVNKQSKNPKRGLWDAIFDRLQTGSVNAQEPYTSTGKDDFRCPEILVKYLFQHDGDTPLLSETVRDRYKKRLYQGLADGGESAADALAQYQLKLNGKGFKRVATVPSIRIPPGEAKPPGR